MLNLAGKTDGAFAASLKPWITVMTNLAAKVGVTVALFTGLNNPMAMAQTRTPFATGVTQPLGGLILSGTAINPQTGKPYRHLWNSDQGGFGLCRLDPDVDTPGPHTVNVNTCMPFVAGVAFKPGQLAFDPALNNIYAVDLQANTQGVFRLHYVPTGDNGHGSLDQLHQEVLGGNNTPGHFGLPGCGIPGNIPNSAVLGPDGNLYIGFKRSGNILRVSAPQTEPLPCSNVQVIGTTPDQTKNFGLGWIGHDMYGGDGLALWTISNADQCMTPQNGQVPCHGNSILTSQTAAPSFVTSDQIYPATTGTNIYVATPASLTLVNTVTLQVQQNYASGFEFLGALVLDPTNLSLYAADDPTFGKLPVQGRWFALGNGPDNGGRQAGTLTEFASGVTSPIGGVVLSGTAINPSTGTPFRHLWTSDLGGFGLCRLDPDVDTPGPHTLNPNTCLAIVAGVQFKPGELAYDPTLNNIYAVDLQANTQGIFRLHYLPDGNGGQGAIDPIHTEVLGGSALTVPVRQQLPGCGIPGNIPDSAVLGPDGSLYIGFRASGNILRVASPQTEPLPCANVQVIGTTPDNKKDFGLGFIGHDLFGGDGLSAWIMVGADVCLQPGTGNTPCQATSILVPQTALPTYVMTDQAYPSLNGRNLFVGKPGSITLVDTVNMKVTMDYATGFQFLSGMALDPINLSLYAADDPTDGKVNAQGHWWLVGQQQQLTPAAPGSPTNVVAAAGDSQATLSWSPATDGQPVTSFTVHNSVAGDGAPVPDLSLTAPTGSPSVPATAVVTGLTNGVAYQFTVAANNSVGTSAFSAPSNAVTPQGATVPDAPTNVVAHAGNATASITWTAPLSNGGAAISSYAVSALNAGAQTGFIVTVAAPATSANFTGLSNGTTYTFVVHATNSAGNSSESAASNAVTPVGPPPPPTTANIAMTLSGPSSMLANSDAGYGILVTNNGSTAIPQLVISEAFTATATVLSATPSQGTCTVGTTITCSLGSVAPGSTVAVGITETLSATVVNSATVQALDASGNPMTLVVPGSGSISLTTNVSAPPPPPSPTPTPSPSPTPAPAAGSSTDLALSGQYVGGAGQGSITWQIQNLGTADAANVVFTQSLPITLSLSSLQATLGGSCSQLGAIGSQLLIACKLPLLPQGQSWSISLVPSTQVFKAVMRARVRFAGSDPVIGNNFFMLSINNTVAAARSANVSVPTPASQQPQLQPLTAAPLLWLDVSGLDSGLDPSPPLASDTAMTDKTTTDKATIDKIDDPAAADAATVPKE